MVTQVISSNSSNWSNIREMNDYNEEDISSKTLLYDSSNPNDDMWRKFSLPLTPPSSPPRTFGETSECSDLTQDIANRLQDVCDNLDSAFDIRNCVLPDAKYLRSRLISDCMWSGSHGTETKEKSRNLTFIETNLSIDTIDSDEDLYPTPCASPNPKTTNESTDYPSSSDCVDPTTVFPLPPSQETLPSILSGQSDSDEEIDVVTVDAPTPPVTVGIKRKHKQISNTIILAKVHTNSTPVCFKRTKSSPTRVSTDKDRISRKSTTNPYESDPETRRATHNVLERKRRIDLKKSFERLRECVPNLEKIDKTPKVIVLKKAAMHIEDLNREEYELEELKIKLRKRNEELKRKVELLSTLIATD